MSVVEELMGGAALGLFLQILQDAIKSTKDRSQTTRFVLERLRTTVINITPLVTQIDMLSDQMEDSQRKIIENLKRLLESVASHVKTYAGLRRRDIFKKLRYKRKIKELEAELRSMVTVTLQVSQSADIKKVMDKMSEVNVKLEEIMRELIPVKRNHRTLQSRNESFLEETEGSSQETAECSYDGSNTKIDAHIGWRSRKRNKHCEIRFYWSG